MEKKKISRKLFVVLFAIGMAYGATYNPCYIRYLFYDSMQEAMNITNTQMAYLGTVRSIFGLCVLIPGGWVADRIAPKKIVGYSVILNLPLCIVSVLFSEVYWLQIVIWALFSFSCGFAFWPAALKAVRLSASADMQDRAFGTFEGCHGVSAMVGNFLAIWIASWFANQVMGYKAAMLSMGVWSAIGGILMLTLYKEDDESAAAEKDSSADAKESRDSHSNVFADTWECLKNPGVWLSGLVITGVYGIYICQTYFTNYFTAVLGVTVTFSAVMANIRQYGLKCVAGPIGGQISGKIKSATVFNGVCLTICIGFIIAVQMLNPESSNIVATCTVLTLVIAFFCLMAKGTMWATMEAGHIPHRITGTAITLMTALSMNATEAFFPVVCGRILDAYPNDPAAAYSKIFMFMTGVALVGIIAAVILVIYDRHYKKTHAAEHTA